MVQIKDLTTIRGAKEILKNINLEVTRGETMVIIGLSGVGKSTLLKHIIGLIKPTRGRILINGIDITTASKKILNQVRKKIGMVFQYSALFDSLTVEQNVSFGLRQHTRLKEKEIKLKTYQMLKLVGMEGKENYLPSEISGGMQKRVALARAIITEPELILYDEPTSGLDPIMTTIISDLINDFKMKFGVTSLVVTHDMTNAFKVADRIAMLHNGELIEIGKPEQFIYSSNPVVKQFVEGKGNGPIKI